VKALDTPAAPMLEAAAIRRSVIGRPAAIAAAEYHRDRATSSLLVGYWDRVIASLKVMP
jgi:hypothetical protein